MADKSGIKTILIADDHDDLRGMLSLFLVKRGYRTIEAENGAVAVARARDAIPDLILMDLQMPDVSGITATQQLRREEGLTDIPIIAISAHGDFGMQLYLSCEELEGAAIEYLTKPLDLDALLELIETLIPRGRT